MKLSQHSKIRMRERTPYNHSERRRLYKMALQKGESPSQIKNDKIREFLSSKENYNSKVKLYKDYVFIHSKNSKQLYTMYKLPKELLEERNDDLSD